MQIKDGGIRIRLSTDANVRDTRNGGVMISGFSVSSKRTKDRSTGEWKDDPYYEPLRASVVIFGSAADDIVAGGGLPKGSVILVTDGVITKPKRGSVDIEVVAYTVEVVERGSGGQRGRQSDGRGRQSVQRASRGVKSQSQSIESAWDDLEDDDLPF